MIQDIEPSKLTNTWRPDMHPEADSPVCMIRSGCIAVRRGDLSDTRDAAHAQLPDPDVSLPLYRDCNPAAGYIYLFSIDDTPWFLAEEAPDLLPDGFLYESVRALRRADAAPKSFVFGAVTALQLARWYRDNRFCGTCGSRTRLSHTERAIVCPKCGRIIYPRIIPAVIVGVTDGDRLLHTRYVRSRKLPYYALVAGFTEIGETLEQTVAREVMEETGLRVKNIRYFASQPWGIVNDLLAGFYCDVDGDTTIRLERSELSEAVWIERKKIVGQPNDFSLTNHMMMTFRDGKEPR